VAERSDAADVPSNIKHAREDKKNSLFQTMARTVAKRWKSISDEDLQYYKELADEDRARYTREMDAYCKMLEDIQASAAKEKADAKQAAKSSGGKNTEENYLQVSRYASELSVPLPCQSSRDLFSKSFPDLVCEARPDHRSTGLASNTEGNLLTPNQRTLEPRIEAILSGRAGTQPLVCPVLRPEVGVGAPLNLQGLSQAVQLKQLLAQQQGLDRILGYQQHIAWNNWNLMQQNSFAPPLGALGGADLASTTPWQAHQTQQRQLEELFRVIQQDRKK
jgi:hypothetical protein